jgi:hypothetical protein
MPGGTTRVIAYIPNETAPPFRDATPTCIAQGPDGMLYVATLHLLDLFVLGETGGADVWRVNPNANYPTAPTLWATGLTTATACTIDRAGNFWATEMFTPTSGPPGDLVRIPFAHPDQLTHIGAGMLPLPGGIAQGPDGAMYVSQLLQPRARKRRRRARQQLGGPDYVVADVLEHHGGAHVRNLGSLGERVEDEVLQRLRGGDRDVHEGVFEPGDDVDVERLG